MVVSSSIWNVCDCFCVTCTADENFEVFFILHGYIIRF